MSRSLNRGASLNARTAEPKRLCSAIVLECPDVKRVANFRGAFAFFAPRHCSQYSRAAAMLPGSKYRPLARSSLFCGDIAPQVPVQIDWI